ATRTPATAICPDCWPGGLPRCSAPGCGRRRRSCRSRSTPSASIVHSAPTARSWRRCAPTTCSTLVRPRRYPSSTGASADRPTVVAVHSATDSCYGWDDYGSLVGARFNGHPWTQSFTLDVLEPDHPALRHLGSTWRWYDEVYQFRDLRPDARVLLRVPDTELDLSVAGAQRPDFGFPLSWCFTEGTGRVFSTTLGHFPGACESVDYLRHLAGGLAWA